MFAMVVSVLPYGSGWTTPRDRLKTRWADSIKHDLHSAGLNINTTIAAQMVFDRSLWKAFVNTLPTLEPGHGSDMSRQSMLESGRPTEPSKWKVNVGKRRQLCYLQTVHAKQPNLNGYSLRRWQDHIHIGTRCGSWHAGPTTGGILGRLKMLRAIRTCDNYSDNWSHRNNQSHQKQTANLVLHATWTKRM